MARTGAVLALFFLILTAGCLGLFDGDEDRQTATRTTTSTTAPQTPESGLTLSLSDVNTDEIVLRLSDTGFGYNFTSEAIEYQENVSEEKKKRFEEKGIVKQHTRVFTRAASNGEEHPTLIRSTVVIYEREEDARRDVQDAVNTINNQGGTTSQVRIASGITAEHVQFEDSNELKTIILYGREKNIVYYVMISGQEQYFEEETEELFIEMTVDVP